MTTLRAGEQQHVALEEAGGGLAEVGEADAVEADDRGRRGTDDRQRPGDVLEEYLAAQTGANWYWPDNDQLRRELATLPVYRRLSRGRLRMVLEAIEDHQRGWIGLADGLGGGGDVKVTLTPDRLWGVGTWSGLAGLKWTLPRPTCSRS